MPEEVNGANVGVSPATKTQAPAQSTGASSSAPTNGGVEQQPKTYTNDELGKIVSQRINEYKSKYEPYEKLGSAQELQARLERLQQYEQLANGKQEQQVDPETRQFREFLEKQYPHLKEMDKIAMAAEMANERLFNSAVQSGHAEIAKLAEERLGIKDDAQKSFLNDMVANSLRSNKEDFEHWRQTGDTGVVRKHFEQVFKNQLEPMLRTSAAKYSGIKEGQIKNTPPVMPKGGTPAPGSKENVLSSEERSSAAFKRFTSQGQ